MNEPTDGANWQDISTAPKDGTRFVAVGNNYGLYSEAQHTCIAQWFRGCWMEVSDWNEASELKYLTHWMPLPPLPGSAASATADSVTAPAGGGAVVEWHAPGLGEVHNESHGQLIFCTDGDDVADDTLARRVCAALNATPPAQAADSVLEDAARLDFLIEQRAYVVSDPDTCPGYWLHFVHKETGKCWVQCDEHPTPRAAIDAAMNKGGA